MKDNKYYTINPIPSIETEDLFAVLYKEVFPEITSEIEEEKGTGWYTKIGRNNNESYPIQIDTLIGILSELKENGSNYVAIDYHIDHVTYLIEGMKISQSTEGEINKFLEKESKRNHKLEKFLKLKDQLNILSKELNNE